MPRARRAAGADLLQLPAAQHAASLPMWNSLRKLLAGRPRPDAASPQRFEPAQASPADRAAPASPSSMATTADAAPSAQPEAALEQRFSCWLLDLPHCSPDEPAPAERSLLAQLEALTHADKDAALVPRLPAALPRLMALVRRSDVSVRELSAHLSADPALVGEVVRLANSPRYRATREIGSLEQAVQLLGQQGLEQLVSRVMLSPVFSASQGRFGRQANARLWELADRCAHGCAFLRQPHGDGFEAYLAGMAAQSGLLVALRLLDQRYREPQAPASAGFHAALSELGERLATQIARNWDFPAAAVDALDARARHSAVEPGSLASALMLAERNAKRQLLGLPLEAREAAAHEAEAPAEHSLIAELQALFGASAQPG